jgi:hypothetical protein
VPAMRLLRSQILNLRMILPNRIVDEDVSS